MNNSTTEARYPKVRFVHRKYSTYSKPYLVTAHDSRRYVMKQFVRPQDRRLLAGEYIATKIGRLLGAPVVDCGIIEVETGSEDLFNGCDMCDGKHVPEAGLYFASHHNEHGQTPAESSDFSDNRRKVLNPQGAAGSVVLDTLFDLVDRNPGNALVVPSKEEKGYHVHLIDQGHILGGPAWKSLDNNAPIRPQMTAGLKFFRVSEQKIVQDLAAYENALASLSRENIIEIAGQVPEEWELDSETQESIANFLVARAPKVIEVLRNHVKGGGQP